MDMQDVIALVNTNRGKGKKKNLNRINYLLNELGNPQTQLKVIHVAGTNGKGSTSSLMMSILREAGYKVGLFTSPHLESINERIRINDTFITDEEFIRLTERVSVAVEKTEYELNESLHAFEILTAVAYLYFSSKPVDVVILEAGIGGRLDATNTIPQSLVSIITSIGLDHVKVLGNTPEKIAEEKAGIVKVGGDLVTFDPPESLKTIFEKKCSEQRATYHRVETSKLQVTEVTLEKQVFDYKQYKNLSIRLLGTHQVRNALLAIEAMEILRTKNYSISDQAIHRGLENAFWPGRWEKISNTPLAFMDGAHNQPAVEELMKTINSLFPQEKITFILGMMQDKSYQTMLETVMPKANKFLTLAPDSERAIESETMAENLRKEGFKAKPLASPREALDYIQHEAEEDEIIVVFGSLYLVGNIKEEMNKKVSI